MEQRLLTPAQTVDEFEQGLDWLDSLSIPALRGRLGAYLRALRSLSSSPDAVPASPALYNTLFEAMEWLTIYQAFGGTDDGALVERLRAFVKGPESAVDEKPSGASSRPRDFAFELYLAARLKARRFDVEFGDEADIHFDYRGHRFWVECKRPKTAKKVQLRTSKALAQLQRRFTTDSDRGLVALSATKIANPSADGLRVPSTAAADAILHGVVQSFVGTHAEHWLRPDRDQRIVGALVEYRQLMYVEDQELVLAASDHALSVPTELSPEDQLLTHRLQTRFSGGRVDPIRHNVPTRHYGKGRRDT